MENKKILGVYSIINNNKIKSLRSFIDNTKEMFDYQKINSSESEFTSYLIRTCYEIDNQMTSTISHYQCNKVEEIEYKKAMDKHKDLSMLLNKHKLELYNLGITESEYLVLIKEYKDSFDFDLMVDIKENKPLPNYSEIKKEFEDFIKIETSTQTLKQNKNLSLAINSIFIETTSKDKFINYLKLHIIEPYVDYSYLFQRMLDENIIVKTKHLDFANWLYENKHITENIKDLFIEKGSFRSLSKSYSTQRENNFNNVFNL